MKSQSGFVYRAHCTAPKTNESIEGDMLQWRQITDKSEAAHAF